MVETAKKILASVGQGNLITTNACWNPSARIATLLDDHNRAVPSVGLERAFHYTDFHKKRGDRYSSPHLRSAYCLAQHLATRTINIYPQELIVGGHTEHRIGAICQIERGGVAMLEDVTSFSKREVNPLRLDKNHRWKLLRSVIPYWLNRNLTALAFSGGRKKLKYLREQLRSDQFIISEGGGIAHFLPNYAGLIQLGTEGLREKIRQKLASNEPLTQQQTDFLDSNLVVLDALDKFADRYRQLAAEQGRDDLVALLDRVPGYPAENIHQALQMIWFFQLVIQIESMDQGVSLGRIDQYLYPLYLAEKAQGRLDEDGIRELIAAFTIKLSEIIPLFSARVTKFFSGLPSGQAMTLGGMDQHGEDCSNELTLLFLDVMESVKTRQPNWHARINGKSGQKYLSRVFEVLAGGGGSPALYNDEVIMPAMARREAPADLLWNYATVGCVEPALPGMSFTSSDAALVNVAINLEMVLGDDKPLTNGKRKKRRYLDQIRNMDQLLDRLRQQVDRQIDDLKYNLDRIEVANAEFFPTPFSSLTVEGCLESATDLTEGGALYNATGIQGVGVADLANSLAVIEVLVFQNKQYTLADVANGCACNFADDPSLRAHALKIVKFGNDDPLVDGLMARVTAIFDDSVSRHSNTRGGKWMPGFYSMTCHRGFGERTAALPSGRLAGEPLADGLAPSDGTDMLGPTASLNSVAALDHKRFGNGINVNLKFDAKLLQGRQGATLLGGLIKGYFAQGGMQLQVNVLDGEILQKAMQNPELYPNLLVRISGYSAYFVDLTREMQQEIIDRTHHAANW